MPGAPGLEGSGCAEGCARLSRSQARAALLPQARSDRISINRAIRPVNRNSIKGALVLSTRQVKAARALLAWSQGDLARQSGVSEPTVARLESVDGPLGGRTGTAEKLRSALEAAGVIFLEENGEGPGVRLKKSFNA